MSKYVLVNVANEDRMLLVDCESMTVDEVDREDLEALADEGLDTTSENVAVVATQRSQPASFPYLERQ